MGACLRLGLEMVEGCCGREAAFLTKMLVSWWELLYACKRMSKLKWSAERYCGAMLL